MIQISGKTAHLVQKSYHHFHNILRLFDVLLDFPSTAIERMRDIRVASRVAERLKT